MVKTASEIVKERLEYYRVSLKKEQSKHSRADYTKRVKALEALIQVKHLPDPAHTTADVAAIISKQLIKLGDRDPARLKIYQSAIEALTKPAGY